MKWSLFLKKSQTNVSFKGSHKMISLGCILFALFSCSPSLQNQRVEERQIDYTRSMEEYHQAEQEYLDLLFNLERYPGDTYLLQIKKQRMQELVTLRSLMLQSRREFDEAVQIWEQELREERAKSLGKPPEAEYFFIPKEAGKTEKLPSLP